MMSRRISQGLPTQLEKRIGWLIALLATVACFTTPEAKGKGGVDWYGDPLPSGALARLGTTRWRHGGDVTFVAFGPKGETLLTAGQGNTLRLWDLSTGKEVRRFIRPKTGARNVERGFIAALSPDGETLAVDCGAFLQLWKVGTGEELRRIEAPANNRLVSLFFSPDNRVLAGRTAEGTLLLWAADTGKEIFWAADTGKEIHQINASFLSGQIENRMAFTPDGKLLASAAGSTVRIWEAATGKDRPLPEGHLQAPIAITLARDGKTAVSWGADGLIRRWETASGKPLGAFSVPPQITLAALSPDTRIVALANVDGTIRLHDAVTGKELHHLKVQAAGLIGLAFTRDGKMLASCGTAENQIRLYDVEAGREVRQIALEAVPSARKRLVFSPGDKLLAVSCSISNRGTLVFLEVATGKELRRIESSQPVCSLAFAPDGRTLATENVDQTITLWEVASSKERGTLGKPAVGPRRLNVGRMAAGSVGLVFSPDGRALVTRGNDESVHIWDVDAGKEISQLKGHDGRIETLAFASDGKTLVSGAADTTLLLWDTASALKGMVTASADELTATEMESFWNSLAGDDAVKALRGVQKLAAAPRQTVLFLGERLKPTPLVDAQKITNWIGELESDEFAVRRRAAANLQKSGEQVVATLQKVLASSPPLETRRHLKELVAKLTSGELTAEQLRLIRAVEVLERIGTAEARQVLRTLTQGASGALSTREAEAALNRLAEPSAPLSGTSDKNNPGKEAAAFSR